MARVRPRQAWLRSETWKRDRGKCASCGLDTPKLLKKLATKGVKPTWLEPGKLHSRLRLALWYTLELWGAPRHLRSLWICDHRVPLALGGCDALHNTQTLCYRCNKRKTIVYDVPRIAKSKRTSKKFARHKDALAQKFPFPPLKG